MGYSSPPFHMIAFRGRLYHLTPTLPYATLSSNNIIQYTVYNTRLYFYFPTWRSFCLKMRVTCENCATSARTYNRRTNNGGNTGVHNFLHYMWSTRIFRPEKESVSVFVSVRLFNGVLICPTIKIGMAPLQKKISCIGDIKLLGFNFPRTHRPLYWW